MKIELTEKELSENKKDLYNYCRNKLTLLKTSKDIKPTTKNQRLVANKFKKELSLNPTKEEQKLKELLAFYNIKYIFQKDIHINNDFIIADFYLPDYNLIIEIDGNQHYTPEGLIKDQEKTKLLSLKGYEKIMRLKNQQVIQLTEQRFKDLLQIFNIFLPV